MSKSRDIADSAATINYIDGLTSDAQSQLDGKATLDASPTFTGTVTATAFSGDGSGLTGVDSLPSQTGNNGLFLTTDGTDASWGEAGGGAWNLLQTINATSGTSVDIETTFDSTYNYYVIVGSFLKGSTTNDPYLEMQMKIAGSYKTANYRYRNDIPLSNSSTYSTSNNNSGSSIILGAQVGTDSNTTGLNFVMNIYAPSQSSSAKVVDYKGCFAPYDNVSALQGFDGFGGNSTNGALTGIRFFWTTGYGASFASGTFSLYGVTK